FPLQIKKFFIHEHYKGDIKNFQDDIALVKLKEELIISKEVRPACIDLNNTFESFDFLDGNNGIVTGWGYVESGSTRSDTLKVITVPYRSPNICLEHLPIDFGQEYFGPDKICAGYKNENRNVCRGDSGGGLYFESGNKRYYVRGIVSITVYVEG
ncbi:Trypsin, partial [Oryctes borbonicus]